MDDVSGSVRFLSLSGWLLKEDTDYWLEFGKKEGDKSYERARNARLACSFHSHGIYKFRAFFFLIFCPM